ncbi:MAG TPA: PAS domain S-box protein [Terracidiphilus sp.]|jgi:PAS domain S-box-containing protein
MVKVRRRKRAAPYGFALASLACATLLRLALDPLLGDHYPLATFYAAVTIVAWYWGVYPAIVTAVLGYPMGSALFLSPRHGSWASHVHTLELPAYIAICTALIACVYRIIDRQRQLDEALEAQRSAEVAVAERDARFKRYLDAMPDIIYTWNADGSRDYFNPRWSEYTGTAVANDAEITERICIEDLPNLAEQRNRALSQGIPLRAEFRLRDRKGEPRWFQTHCVPILDDSGSITGWVGRSIDIDGEKRAVEALELSEQRYRSVSEAFDFGMWSADKLGRLTFVSPQLLQFLGASIQEAQERLWSALLTPKSEQELTGWQGCFAKGEPWDRESQLVGADGTIRRVWSRGVPLRSPDGPVTSWVGLTLDVTERYAAERARDQARQQLEVVTDRMSVGVAQCNQNLEFVWVNPAYARQLGLTPNQLRGRRVENVVGPDTFKSLVPYIQRVLAGESVQFERAETISGSPARWISAVYTPIWNGRATPVGWVAVMSDLTERRVLEEQLREANRQKDRFLAILAHELRNPLAPIRYATRLLGPEVPVQMAADARRMIDRQLAHMARLLDDLLDVSRITRGVLEVRRDALDLRTILRQAVEAARPLASAVDHRLDLELPEEALPVLGDEIRLIQVIGNLINNAIKYTNPGGHIWVSATESSTQLMISVRDNGRGITHEMLPRVFDLFAQGEPGARAQTGLGIGLALVKQFVELHGGSVDAHSEGVGRGSEFRILLPKGVEVAAVTDSTTAQSNIAALGAGKVRVLIVDDNVDAANALAQLLRGVGYQPHIAYDGRSAIEMAEILKPGVALLDLGLPHMSGHEVAQHLRARPWGRAIRLIAVTGWGGKDDLHRSREAGFDEHLTKPVDPDVLISHIVRLTRIVA